MADEMDKQPEANMTDDRPNAYGVAYGSEPTTIDEAEPEEDRRTVRVIGLVLLVVAAILILMLRGCGGLRDATGARSNKIVPVAGERPIEGAVSVWVKPDSRLAEVLSATGIYAKGRTNLGEGRWVITVPEGQEAAAISALKSNDAVYDAGLVYTDPTRLPGEATVAPAAPGTD